jgi:dTDP-4-dehydrorhamnose 3,5-epimerase
MKLKAHEISGLYQIEPQVFEDSRGFFFEMWNDEKFRAAGIDMRFAQDNVSRSVRGVLRGLHFQKPDGQAKLVSVLDGEIFDVVVDLRQESPTFKKWTSFVLTSKNRTQILIPEGFAHGFQVLSENALFTYKCSSSYRHQSEKVLRWDDPELRIDWPISSPTLSDKDLRGKLLKEFSPEELF